VSLAGFAYARHTACRANHDPTLGATIVRQRRNVLDWLELKDVHEEVDCRLMFLHNQRYQFEVRHQSLPISELPREWSRVRWRSAR
jgi:hypothetical protein